MPPSLVLVAAALVLPLCPLVVRRLLCVIGPLAALLAAASLAEGNSWTTSFLGYPVILARRDALSDIFGLIFGVAAFAANLYGWHRKRTSEQVAALLYVGGGMGVVFAGDLLSFLTFWEVMAVASALLVFGGGRPASPPAGQRYLLVHLAAGGLMLVGVLLVAENTGTTNFDALGGTGWGGTLILLALCINAAVPPLHAWLPDAYPQASVSGSVFLSTFTTKAAVYCLLRGFAGAEVLIWAGALMAFYGVFFAVMENNMRRLLSYHIVSQVGYMVCGVGVGTELALNGSVAHAVCHILYKALLFMAVGAVVYRTGRERLSELGGLRVSMPVTLTLYTIGALSISGAPLFNGFISKSLVVSGAAEAHLAVPVLLLNLAAVGTFLSVGLKLPYFAWGPGPQRPRATEPPPHMLAAMGIAAVLCIGLGLFPGVLYERLPFGVVDYHPYTAAHVFEMLSLMIGTGIAFWLLRLRLEPHALHTLDLDQLYRWPSRWLVWGVSAPLDLLSARLGAAVATARAALIRFGTNPPLVLRGRGAAAPGDGRAVPRFDENTARVPLGRWLTWLLAVFVLCAGGLLLVTRP
jgi:multicomponent Na+:H+ antiporter subunit D